MSHWITLIGKDGKVVEVPVHSEGGTYALGGLPEAELNVTYNYSKFYYQTLNKEEGIRWLNGKKAKEVQAALSLAIHKLGTVQHPDYWRSTRGNAGYALSILLKWAELYPEAKFEIN